jgi:hypothetical protein
LFIIDEFMFKSDIWSGEDNENSRPGIKICWWQVEEKNQLGAKAASSKAFQSLCDSHSSSLLSLVSDLFITITFLAFFIALVLLDGPYTLWIMLFFFFLILVSVVSLIASFLTIPIRF